MNATSTSPSSSETSTPSSEIILIPAKVPEDSSSQFIRHFFSNFLTRNDFAVGVLDLNTIIYQCQSSPSLHHASIAIGALDLSTQSTCGRRAATLAALNSYRASITNFQTEIQAQEIQRQDASLWTTLFLGLFEVLSSILFTDSSVN